MTELIEYKIRTMEEADYDRLFQLWTGIKGFSIRNVDDSREGILRFLKRNPTTSVVAEYEGELIGSILCGHDGRRGCLYHVCVRQEFRQHGIGFAMVQEALELLAKEQISKVSLLAFQKNEVGNAFWKHSGWTLRDDVFQYEYTINEDNTTWFVGQSE